MRDFSFKARVAAFAVLLGLVGAVSANAQIIQAELVELTLEERTELAFIDKTDLPRHYTPGKQQNFDFYYINYENQEVEYSFEVIARGPGGKTAEIGSGGGQSGHNIKGVVSPEFNLNDMGENVEIIVELNYETEEGKQSESISFWVERQKLPGGQFS